MEGKWKGCREMVYGIRGPEAGWPLISHWHFVCGSVALRPFATDIMATKYKKAYISVLGPYLPAVPQQSLSHNH